MKGLAVAVMTENEGYGKALARGIACESERVSVKVVCTKGFSRDELLNAVKKADKEGCITLLDGYGGEYAESGEAYEKRLIFLSSERSGGRFISKLSPVREIFGVIKEIYFKTSGAEFYRLHEGEERIIGFFPETGGCGCTAIAVTVCRWLSLISDEPVLYVNAGLSDDYKYYISGSFDERSSCFERAEAKKEMIFRIAEDMPWNVEKYCGKDALGVFFFKPEERKNCLSERKYLEKLLASLSGKRGFSYIAADGLREGEEYFCDVAVGVSSAADRRSGLKRKEERFINVFNFCGEFEKPCSELEEDSFFENGENLTEREETSGKRAGECGEYGKQFGGIGKQCDELKKHRDGFEKYHGEIGRQCGENGKAHSASVFIPTDRDSFTASENGVEISMEGVFAYSVKAISSKLLKESENGE